MQSSPVYSVTSHVKNWLADSKRPRILHVFDHACNLINEKREVVSLVTQWIGKGPFNLVIDEDVLFSQHLVVDSPVSMFADQLIVSDWSFQTDHAALWDPRPDWEKLHCQRDAVFSLLRELQITNDEFRTSSFSSALLHRDIEEAKVYASQIAGLGYGLTPAGDDFLMGAIYAAWILHPSEFAGPFLQQIASTVAPLTTSLSSAWLIAAGNGEAGILWHQFFEALLSADKVRSQKAMDKIVTVGETSGMDAMAGFVGTALDCVPLKRA